MIAQPPEDTPREYTGQACPNCGLNFPARSAFTDWGAAVIAERCRLALFDPAGEHDQIAPWPRRFDWPSQTCEPERVGWQAGAAHPLDGVRARAILLHLAEPQPRPYRPAPRPGAELDERALLERLGCDLSRDHGMIRCPAHEDRAASLSWRWDGSKALLHCFAGCSFDELRGAA
jgi:hypothetical protein